MRWVAMSETTFGLDVYIFPRPTGKETQGMWCLHRACSIDVDDLENRMKGLCIKIPSHW
jgi:hypothetical protein